MHVLSLFISVYWTVHNTHEKNLPTSNVWQNPKHQQHQWNHFSLFQASSSTSLYAWLLILPHRQHLHEYCRKINHFSHFHLACTNSKHCDITNTFGIHETKNNTMKEQVKNTRQLLFLVSSYALSHL